MSVRNERRIEIYIMPGDKIKLIRKAQKLGFSVSKLMVHAALEYGSKNYEGGN